MGKKLPVIFGLAVLITVFAQCAKTGADAVGTDFKALPLAVIFPADNVQTPQKIALGQALFWDPILSGNKDVACASCHHPSLGYSDHLDLSIGVKRAGIRHRQAFSITQHYPLCKAKCTFHYQHGFQRYECRRQLQSCNSSYVF